MIGSVGPFYKMIIIKKCGNSIGGSRLFDDDDDERFSLFFSLLLVLVLLQAKVF